MPNKWYNSRYSDCNLIIPFLSAEPVPTHPMRFIEKLRLKTTDDVAYFHLEMQKHVIKSLKTPQCEVATRNTSEDSARRSANRAQPPAKLLYQHFLIRQTPECCFKSNTVRRHSTDVFAGLAVFRVAGPLVIVDGESLEKGGLPRQGVVGTGGKSCGLCIPGVALLGVCEMRKKKPDRHTEKERIGDAKSGVWGVGVCEGHMSTCRSWREVLRTELPVLSISLFGKRVRKIEGGSTCAGRGHQAILSPWLAIRKGRGIKVFRVDFFTDRTWGESNRRV